MPGALFLGEEPENDRSELGQKKWNYWQDPPMKIFRSKAVCSFFLLNLLIRFYFVPSRSGWAEFLCLLSRFPCRRRMRILLLAFRAPESAFLRILRLLILSEVQNSLHLNKLYARDRYLT